MCFLFIAFICIALDLNLMLIYEAKTYYNLLKI